MTLLAREQISLLDPQIFCLVLLHTISSTKARKECKNCYWGATRKFFCKCEFLNCGSSGECVDGSKCSSGWFGPSCQYLNLLRWYPGVKPGLWIVDGERFSCNPHTDDKTIQVSLTTSVLFTWLRCSFSPRAKGLISNISLTFGKFKNPCRKKRMFFLSVVTVDITCDMHWTGSVRSLTLSGPAMGHLCSLYINGGRNLAVKQKAVQSSVHPPFVLSAPSNAVDGVSESVMYMGSCSRTLHDQVAFWKVYFDTEVILYRVRVVNRNKEQDSLAGFTLRLFNRYGKKVFQTLTPSAMLDFYDLDLGLQPPVIQSASITKEHTGLTLCEFFAFGEVLCPAGMWGLSCERKCRCGKNQSCFQATGVCGPACPVGSYGVNCGWKCPELCKDSICEERTGNCKQCVGNAKGDRCEKGCNPNLSGPSCKLECRCPNNQCSSSGDCPEGTPCLSKYFGPGCRYEDLINSFNATVTEPCLSDGNFSTCSFRTFSFEITFQQKNLTFNWMRVVLSPNKKPVSANTSELNLILEFKPTNLKCRKKHFYRLSSTVLDIHCYPPTRFVSLTVTGESVRQICEIYISGNTPCPPTKFGYGCSEDCFCLKNGRCSEATGNCENGCPPSKYGQWCTLDCPNTCFDQACDLDGKCISCPEGFSGPKCEFAHCNDTIAPYCKSKQCLRSGTCPFCLGKRRGPACTLDCPTTCGNRSCSDQNLECLGCQPGMAGHNCTHRCSTKCQNNLCNQYTFACQRCREENFYGKDCTIPCPTGCKDNRCNSENGSCLSCNDGFYGSRCDVSCASSCKDHKCEINGMCVQETKNDAPSGALWYITYIPTAIIGVTCLTVVLYCVRKRLKHKGEQETGPE